MVVGPPRRRPLPATGRRWKKVKGRSVQVERDGEQRGSPTARSMPGMPPRDKTILSQIAWEIDRPRSCSRPVCVNDELQFPS